MATQASSSSGAHHVRPADLDLTRETYEVTGAWSAHDVSSVLLRLTAAGRSPVLIHKRAFKLTTPTIDSLRACIPGPGFKVVRISRAHQEFRARLSSQVTPAILTYRGPG